MDKNINPKTNLKKLIKLINRDHKVGIHPSYRSFNKINIVKQEINLLKETINEEITQSRFHYLRFSFPESFQILTHLGINLIIVWVILIG